jgi:hypothetical protein
MYEAPPASPDLLAELKAAIAKVEINSPFAFAFEGEPPVDIRAGRGSSALAQGVDGALARAIQAKFYDRCYARRRDAMDSTPNPAFARALSAANASRDRWDRGWTLRQYGPNGQVFVAKGDRERAAPPGGYVFEGPPGAIPQVGAALTLRAPREAFDAQPNYYFAFGETLDELTDQMSLVRVYFNLAAEAASAWLGELTAGLNRFQTPFQYKTPSAPGLYGRADAGVLYVGRRYFPIVSRIVEGSADRFSFDEATPLFTKRLRRGIAAAVEPGTGESFGSHRSRLVAEALVEAWSSRAQTPKLRFDAVERRFKAEGLDVTKPWAGPTGVDPFAPVARRSP